MDVFNFCNSTYIQWEITMDLSKNLSFLVLLLCLLITLENQNSETSIKRSFHSADYSSAYSCSLLRAPSLERKLQQSLSGGNSVNESLKYDYYRESCPLAEQIIRSTVQNLFNVRQDVAPALLRLFFHDCFIEVKFTSFTLVLLCCWCFCLFSGSHCFAFDGI